jgi:signal peptidase II
MKLLCRDLGLIAAAGALIADQGSKLVLLYGFGFASRSPYDAVSILPFFNLRMVWNRGVSYGLFQANSRLTTIILILLAFAAISGLFYWLWHTSSRSLAIGLGLIIGGAIGNNLIDRVIYGSVADFFDFHAFNYDWYVFNIADVAITLGAIAILYEVLRPQAQPEA